MIKFANAPCSWGVIEGYGFGGLGYAALLDQMAEAGYDGAELGNWGFMPTDPKKLRAELRARDLRLAGSWIFSDMQEVGERPQLIEQALKVAELLAEVGDAAVAVFGADHVRYAERHAKAGRITPADGFNAERWRVYADGVNLLADAIKRETGVACALHPHCATWIETPQEIATALDLLDKDLIGLCVDTGHFTYGGSDLLKAFDLYAERINHIHLKDCDNQTLRRVRAERVPYGQAVADNVFCNLGAGDVDFAAVFNKLRASGYSGWAVVEQDIGQGGLDDPRQNAIDNLKYVKRLYQQSAAATQG